MVVVVVVVVSEEDSSIVFCYTWVYGEITTVDGNGGQSAFGFCPEEVADPDAEVERGCGGRDRKCDERVCGKEGVDRGGERRWRGT